MYGLMATSLENYSNNDIKYSLKDRNKNVERLINFVNFLKKKKSIF